MIPFLDLKAQYETIKDEIGPAIQAVINQTAFAGGPFVEKFENEFAAYCQVKQAVAVNSGTSALWLSLLALGIGRGDEVITVPNTFIATAEAISLCGATPVFVDVDEASYNLNPALLEEAITPLTKAIIPVHLLGQMADMDPIMQIARKHHLLVIEDACQAHGAEYKGRRAGSIGDAGCFSFYPGKNLGAYGEGGAIVTNNAEFARTLRMLRDHGQSQKYYHSLIGMNARMDGMQGAILSVKLKHLDEWNTKRRTLAKLYSQQLAATDSVILPQEMDYAKHVYHIYALRVQNRDQLIQRLKEKEIYCAIHYPVPIHLQEAYRFMNFHAGQFPVAEQCAAEFVSLPMFGELTTPRILHTVEVLLKSLKI